MQNETTRTEIVYLETNQGGGRNKRHTQEDIFSRITRVETKLDKLLGKMTEIEKKFDALPLEDETTLAEIIAQVNQSLDRASEDLQQSLDSAQKKFDEQTKTLK